MKMSSYILSLLIGHSLNIAALSFLLYLLGKNILMSKDRIHTYRLAIILTILAMVLECAGILLDRAGASWWAANLAVNIMGFSCSSLIPYVLAWSGSESSLKTKRILLLFPLCTVILCIASSETGWLFTVSHSNVYSRGPLFWIYIVNYLIGVFLIVGTSYGTASRLARQERRYLLGIYVFFLIGVSTQILYPEVHTSWQCITLCLLLYYIFQREIQFRYDPLTGVLNRAAFDKEMETTPQNPKILVILDVDNFKAINDSHGHVEGDRILSTVGRILRKCFIKCGNCYRIGGDEFAILSDSSEVAFRSSIRKLIRRVERERAHTPWFPNISYGYHVLQPGESLPAAFQKADAQMYRYKRR